VLDLNYDPETVQNLAEILENQKRKFEELRGLVRNLEFIPIDPSGSYSPITFKSFDGGMFNLILDPYEVDIVEVADSNGNSKLRFAAPKGNSLSEDELKRVIARLNDNPIIKRFVSILGKENLNEVSEILTDRGTLMELGEYACIFDKVMSASNEERTIILKDGLLRTKKIKAELIDNLRTILHQKKGHVKLVGVSKTSKIVSLLSAALVCEKVFPSDHAGFVEIPLELEDRAYRWTGSGKLKAGKVEHLKYAFGTLYIVKLSRSNNLLVTIEIPKDLENNKAIYSKQEIMEMMNYLAKDSLYSYPIIGYPQTIMKAHEFAVRLGIPASILRDKIMNEIMNNSDSDLAEYIRDGAMLRESVEKGNLGGRA
jgi:hypothetical protein